MQYICTEEMTHAEVFLLLSAEYCSTSRHAMQERELLLSRGLHP